MYKVLKKATQGIVLYQKIFMWKEINKMDFFPLTVYESLKILLNREV